MRADAAWRALRDAVGLLESVNAPYVLDGGTLLGLFRDGWFFPHDKDVDITLLDEHDGLRRVQALAAPLGFSVFRAWNVTPDGSAKVMLRRDRVIVDLVSKHEVGDDAVWVLRGDPSRVKRMPARYYRERGVLTVRGVEFSVPADTEGYLAARFGSDWRTPKPSWDRLRDDRAYRATP